MAIKTLYRAFPVALCLTAHAIPAQAENPNQIPQNCRHLDQITAALEAQYREFPAGYGITETGSMVSLFQTEASNSAQTWSLTLTDPRSRITCIMASGEGWRMVPAIAGPES